MKGSTFVWLDLKYKLVTREKILKGYTVPNELS